MKNIILLSFLLSLFFAQCQGQDLEHELFLNHENELIEYTFPKPTNNDHIKSFSFKTFKNENIVFHFWTKSEDENVFFENELIELQKIQIKYQDSVRIIVITNCNEKTIKRIIDTYKLQIPIVIDSGHRAIFQYETPFSAYYQKGILKSMTYSTFVLENEIDKYLLGKESISPDHAMMWTCKFPLNKYKFPASFNSRNLQSFRIKDLITRQTVIYIWTEEDCYFCLSDLLLANEMYKKYKPSTQFVVISKLPQSRVQKILEKYNIDIPWVVDEGHRKILPNLNPLFLIYDANGELLTFEMSAHIAQEQLESFLNKGIFKK